LDCGPFLSQFLTSHLWLPTWGFISSIYRFQSSIGQAIANILAVRDNGPVDISQVSLMV
jgi:hypothetical protein